MPLVRDRQLVQSQRVSDFANFCDKFTHPRWKEFPHPEQESDFFLPLVGAWHLWQIGSAGCVAETVLVEGESTGKMGREKAWLGD